MLKRIKIMVLSLFLCIAIAIRPVIGYEVIKANASPITTDDSLVIGNGMVNLLNSPSQTQCATSAAIVVDYPVTIDDQVFPDDNFRAYISQNIDSNQDGVLSLNEVDNTYTMVVNSMDIKSLEGLEIFCKLTDFHCGGNPLGTIDVSKNTELRSLYCFRDELTDIDVSKNTKLEYFSCDGNKITELDLSQNTNLVRLDCHDNLLTELDLSYNPRLRDLVCQGNSIEVLDISDNEYLKTAYELGSKTEYSSSNKYAYGNSVQYILEINKRQTLRTTSVYETFPIMIDENSFPDYSFREYVMDKADIDKDGYISLEEAEGVTEIIVNDMGIHSLKGIEAFKNLNSLHCGNNPLGSLNVSNNIELTSLYCFNDDLSAIDIAKNVKLEYFSCDGNSISSLNLRNNVNLVRIDCHDNILTKLDISRNINLRELICYKNDFSILRLAHNQYLANAYMDGTCAEYATYYQYNSGNIYIIETDKNLMIDTSNNIEFPLAIDEDNFPDAAFRRYILGNIDRNSDGVLSKAEMENTTEMIVNNLGISSMDGLQYFTNLRSLHCGWNEISELDVSKNVLLDTLYCFDNNLTSIDLSNNKELVIFSCDGNSITDLSLEENSKLRRLDCHNNNLTELDLSNNPNINELYCYGNNISELDIGIFAGLKAAYKEGTKTEYPNSCKYVYNKDSVKGILEIDKNQAVITEISHLWGAPLYTWSENNGQVTAKRICQNDDSHIETETVATTAVTRAAICFEAGEVTYTSDAFENSAFEVQTKTVVIPALGHDWGKVNYIWSEDNSKVTAIRICQNDDSHFETEVVSVTSVVSKAAICVEPGVIWHVSDNFTNNAFEVQIKTEEIPALGHDWGEVIYAWTDDNSKLVAIRMCKNDASHIEAEVVNVTSAVTKAAICLEPGVLWHISEDFKNSAFQKQIKPEEIPALGHNWGNVVYTWSDDNNQVTATRVCLNDLEHIETETVNTVKSTKVNTDGSEYEEYSATFTNHAFETQINIVPVVRKGDVNGDGVINSKDVTVLRRYIAGGWNVKIIEANSDINGDGTINAKDVTMLRRALVGDWEIVL